MDKRVVATAVIIGAIAAGSTTIEAQQEIYRFQHGKYKQYMQDEIKSGVRVDEYVSSEGPGYQITLEERRQDGLYRRSYGVGPESSARSYDWTLVDTDLPTSSSTPRK